MIGGRVHASMSEAHMLSQELLREREGKRSSKVAENFEQLEKAIVGKLGAEEMLFEPTLRQIILSAANGRFLFGYTIATSLLLGPVWLIEVIGQSFFSKPEILGFALGHISIMFSFPLIIQFVGILDQMLDFLPNYFPPSRFRSWGRRLISLCIEFFGAFLLVKAFLFADIFPRLYFGMLEGRLPQDYSAASSYLQHHKWEWSVTTGEFYILSCMALLLNGAHLASSLFRRVRMLIFLHCNGPV